VLLATGAERRQLSCARARSEPSAARSRALGSGTPYTQPVTTARRVHHSYEEYLRALEISGVKLEFCEGEIYAMAGGTPAHAELAGAITRLLGNALLGHARIASSDLKVRIETTDLSTFADVTVIYGERKVATADRNAITNPSVLVEVTSAKSSATTSSARASKPC
jgi:Uma2 family endonuclease